MNSQNRKWSLNSRLFTMLTLLLIAVFLLIFVIFNVLLDNYINSSMASQLGVYTNRHRANDGWSDVASQPKSKMGVRTETFVIDSNYNILHVYDETQTLVAEKIIQAFLEQGMSIMEVSNLRIAIQEYVYFLSSIPDNKHKDSYLVFFADITAITAFSDSINRILLIVMMIGIVIALGITIIITYSVTVPINELSKFAQRIGKGDFTHNHSSYIDKEISELANEMNKSAHQLASYDSSQKIFFQNVSHELRTPLMSIKLNAEGIKYGLMEKERSSDIIISEVDYLSVLVEDLLYISRVDNITNQVEMEENDIRETLSFCALNLKTLVDEKNISLVYDFSEEPALIFYNEKHMCRAFSNLISNAIRYAKSTITLTCKSENDKIIIIVADDGNGILEKDLPHIFERFYKGTNGRNGIGLSIVKSVIDLHKAKIEVICSENTQFIIKIPMNR